MQTLHSLRTILLFLVLIVPLGFSAQSEDLLYEEFLQKTNEEDISIESLELITDRFTGKIDINQVDFEGLKSTGFLDDLQIERILRYRDELGPFIAIYELQAVPGLSVNKAILMSKLFYIQQEQDLINAKNRAGKKEHKFLLKWQQVMEKQKGFNQSDTSVARYLGNPAALRLKYAFNSGKKWRMALLVEKDAGESFSVDKDNYLFDHQSFYLEYRPAISVFEKWIIGDFRVSFGQGLIQGGSYFSGKSTSVMNFSQAVSGIRPSCTATEFGYKRGAAAVFDFGKLQCTGYFSGQKIDSSLDTLENVDTGVTFVQTRSLIKTGYHRSYSESTKNNNQWQISTGLLANYVESNWRIGASLSYIGFEYPLQFHQDVYKSAKPESKHYLHGSLSHFIRLGNSLWSGEFAYLGQNNSIAFIESIQFGLSKELDIGLLYRYYARGFHAFDQSAFGESSGTDNEKGIYLSLKFRPAAGWQLAAYTDYWIHPWLKYNIDAPTRGYEYFLKLEYVVKRKWSAYLLFRQKLKQLNGHTADLGMNDIISQKVSTCRLQCNVNISRDLEMRHRLEWKNVPELKLNGYLLYTDVLYRPLGKKWSATFRYALFDSDDHITGLYSFENDLLYSFSIPIYSQNGSRCYLNLRYKYNRNITMEMHAGRSFYPFENEVSSGNDEISDNHKTTLKAQLRIKF